MRDLGGFAVLEDDLIARLASYDALDLRELVTGSDEERLRVGADFLVRAHRQRQEQIAVKVRAFAHELVHVPVAPAVRRGDLLDLFVDLTEDRFVFC